MSRDPYKYFRVEARELIEGLSQGVLEIERSGTSAELVARLLRQAHTLKGAARVVKQPKIAELAHALEDRLTSHREGGGALGSEEATALLRLLDEMSARLAELDQTREARTPATTDRGAPAAEESLDTVRVEVREMDVLLRGVTEAGVQLGAMDKDAAALERLCDLARALASHPSTSDRTRSLAEVLSSDIERFRRNASSSLERLDRGLAEVREVANGLRLVPAKTLFPALDRAVRDAAQSMGRRVELEAIGGEVRLDASVLAGLKDALLHVARNAVVHGIEPETDRIAAGKKPGGQIRLAVERRGARVAFTLSDDGRGVDVEAVRRAAVASRIASPSHAASMSAEEVLALLRGGLTTSEGVTELSGRGIGLDVVRETASRLKGEMNLRSEPGRGTTIEIRVPVSISSLGGLIVEAGGTVAAIPIDSVERTMRVPDREVARAADGESISYDDRAIPFLPLERALRRPGVPSRRKRTWSAVVVRSGPKSVAIGVDRLLGTSSIVMRSLPRVVQADPVIFGASLDAEGNPQLVLDPKGLVDRAHEDLSRIAADAAPNIDPILVIDDSLTTRMLEQTILQSAGYKVELAVSAEEALEKARERRYSLFIVDVEMPGMDGFEFVEATRSDTTLEKIPAILVTSRNAPEDRRRGEQAGARAYIVKSEFDQGKLLETIRRLIG
jgi:two-component system, chemotaxis family, sensor kinase CheA